jgi:putative methionine-R-sulfoxide reductase with GAF domain
MKSNAEMIKGRWGVAGSTLQRACMRLDTFTLAVEKNELLMERTLSQLRALAHSSWTREERSQTAVRLIRALGPYRWAALCDVRANEIAAIAWDDPEPPTYPRSPALRGLTGAAVASKRPVIVQNVATVRYLTTTQGTRGEMVQPILRPPGVVVGTIDVGSAKINAFNDRDRSLLAACAEALEWLWPGSSTSSPALAGRSKRNGDAI